MIQQAFLHVDEFSDHVVNGRFDLVGPQGDIILPVAWDALVQPGWSVTMQMLPSAVREPLNDQDSAVPAPLRNMAADQASNPDNSGVPTSHKNRDKNAEYPTCSRNSSKQEQQDEHSVRGCLHTGIEQNVEHGNEIKESSTCLNKCGCEEGVQTTIVTNILNRITEMMSTSQLELRDLQARYRILEQENSIQQAKELAKEEALKSLNPRERENTENDISVTHSNSITLKDFLGRSFKFPVQSCGSWEVRLFLPIS